MPLGLLGGWLQCVEHTKIDGKSKTKIRPVGWSLLFIIILNTAALGYLTIQNQNAETEYEKWLLAFELEKQRFLLGVSESVSDVRNFRNIEGTYAAQKKYYSFEKFEPIVKQARHNAEQSLPMLNLLCFENETKHELQSEFRRNIYNHVQKIQSFISGAPFSKEYVEGVIEENFRELEIAESELNQQIDIFFMEVKINYLEHGKRCPNLK